MRKTYNNIDRCDTINNKKKSKCDFTKKAIL